MTTRREFLRQLGTASIISLGGLPPAFVTRAAYAARQAGSESKDGRILVLVELAGGNDGLNTVVPFARDEYYKARPGLGIGKGAVLKLDDSLGLHPDMTAMHKLYEEGVLSVVQGVGYPKPDRSHFRSMDIWHTGISERDDTRAGWLGRLLDQQADKFAGGTPALAIGREQLPLALLASKIRVPLVRDLDTYRLQLGEGPKQDQELRKSLLSRFANAQTTAGSNLDFIRRTATAAYTTADRLHDTTAKYKPAVEYPQSGLGQQLRLAAQIIAGEFGTQVLFVSLGGFDTHSQQPGAHAALLRELSEALGAFSNDLKEHKLADRVLTATFSEFGRRVKENASLGTDHGAASQMFVVAPKLKTKIHGAHPSLTDLDDGDLKFHTDFRRVYATLLEGWLGFPSQPALENRFEPIPLLG